MPFSAKKIHLKKKSESQILPLQILHANNFFDRLVGLMGKSSIKKEEAILLEPCSQVHSFFMQFPIEIVFLDNNFKILKISKLVPWRVSPLVRKAKSVLELSPNTCAVIGLKVGDELEVHP